jgi:tagatose-6-phosphate ketose/aldose isomerase
LAALSDSAGIGRETERVLDACASLRRLPGGDEGQRVAAGYGHTLREIVQQPLVWADTALRATEFAGSRLVRLLRESRAECVALTGSGSSQFAAELAAPEMQARLGLPVRAIGSGDILAYGAAALPPGRPLVISYARSGNSPESAAVLRVLMAEQPEAHYLNVTCNAQGRLVTEHAGDSRVGSLLLHAATHDESLVMTSSFTSMALATVGLGWAADRGSGEERMAYADACGRACQQLRAALPQLADAVAALPFGAVERAVFLGAGCQAGAAREAALKLTEMTAGRVVAFNDTFLGLRHGPMAALDAQTLIVGFLPTEPRPRRYAIDLLRELARKQLGCVTVVVDAGEEGLIVRGAAAGPDAAGPDAAGPDAERVPEPFAALLAVVAGQLLGFFASLHHGLKPDAPAASGVITRVVEPFPLYH